MKTASYYIIMIGESAEYTVKTLTDSEYKLISEIFKECESEYVGGYIYKIPDLKKLYKNIQLDNCEDLPYSHILNKVHAFIDNSSECFIEYVSGKLYDIYLKNKQK